MQKEQSLCVCVCRGSVGESMQNLAELRKEMLTISASISLFSISIDNGPWSCDTVMLTNMLPFHSMAY